MEMEAPRRSALERSREPSTKKPRLGEDEERGRGLSSGLTADRSRPYAQVKAAVGGGGGGGNPKYRGAVMEREEKKERDNAGRGGASFQQQQELVAQYRTALAELTFNSKPIITNLTIIAGENLHSAKSIAATVCANVLEVPSEQKLPSLYLLDSIVKNIGRDYIKYFAARLPEVFCKAYKQVDPSVHPSLRHLFGTWKGVFPASCLQSIEKELGFQPIINGSSGETGTKSDVHTQRTPHSIHVNVKYLEARQRLQQSTRGKEISSDDTEEDVTPVDAERSIRSTSANSTGSLRQWSELSKRVSNVQLPQREQPSDFTNDKKGFKDIRDPGLSSQLLRQPDIGVGRIIDRVSEVDEMGRTIDQVKESDEPNKLFFGAGGAAESTVYRRNGFDGDHVYTSYKALDSVPNKSQVPSSHLNKTKWPASKSWKASEEEEYVWDDMGGSRSVNYEGAGNKRNSWSTDDQDKPTNLQNHKWLSTETEQVDSRLNKFDVFQPRASISGTEDRNHFPREHEEHFLQPNSQETETRVTRSSWPLPLYDTSLPAVALDRGISRVSCQTERRTGPIGGTLSKNDNSAVSRSGFHSSNPSSLGASMDVLGSGGMLGQQRQLPLRSPSPTFPSVPSAPPQQQKLRAPSDQDFLPVILSQISQNSRQLAGQFNRDKLAPFSSDTFPNSSDIPGQKVHTTLNSQPSLPHVSQPALSPFLDLKQHLSPLQQSHPDLSMQAVQNETSSYASHVFRPNETKGFSSAMHSSSPVDISGQSNTSNLLASFLKTDPSPNKPVSGLNIQPPLPSGPPPAQALTSSPFPTSTAEMTSSHGIVSPGLAPPLLAGMLPPLPPGPPPSASVLSTSSQIANSNSMALNPLSSLLSSLVAKGIITSTSTQFPTVSSSQMSKESTSQNSDLDGITSTSPPLEELPVQRPSTPCPENLIGIQFKTEIVREFHPSVIDSLLDDLKHQCSECGFRFRHQEQQRSHLDWHQNNSESSSIDKLCRRWYSSKLNWVSGDVDPQCGPVPSTSLGATSEEHLEPMVRADESQSVCVFCGEPFEDFYSVEKDEWMYKGTIYLNLMDGKYVARSMKDGLMEGPIVHAKCISASDVHGDAAQCT